MASEDKLFENLNRWTDRQTEASMDEQMDRQKVITIDHPEHSSGELKLKHIYTYTVEEVILKIYICTYLLLLSIRYIFIQL